ncbi:hypothetical protein JQ557_16165 [Bradyrhizobium sp. U87765 SZCCT0131]|uniref:hypothetical protein n=1 Tax=unclassified Bradyrhizobium TaxID=2631580 RepID=UPI001BA5D016|nr:MULTISPECIES: hypothetical protein [unclassified Bradyrhizobium]MBR1219541.1 hypothetical protein [Bradyrhizobium sp. U87765 SZCCT0131]MBR1262192.1 hypothetical protein [Bradyrhizobium sp. U87765 SZCCT0134]MBR1308625.1 hypothetical protein [Bradyrhizobium sp. U87765 SZCCT0110]MBR1317974.1 hypothetical protein [Bradyrhizobium sp. U87765 SZCCT0109]MBR1351677.1 hypothetical protein [Bradyrhizobium sp. U87765 SZCCT0048]
MIVSDVTCECGAFYRRAEASSLTGHSGQFRCSCCGALVESWEKPKARVYRLVIAPERLYQHPHVPPSPLPSSPPTTPGHAPHRADAA